MKSETLIIGIDISDNNDIPTMVIARCMKDKREIINVLYGKEAEETYEYLTVNRHHKIHLDTLKKEKENNDVCI